jgi:hypothetical protein
MSKLGKVYTASFQTGALGAAGDYPSGGSGVFLPEGALVVKAYISEQTALASGTNVKIVCGSTDLMGVLATASIEDFNDVTLTANKITAAGELKLTTTGTYTGAATVHVLYLMESAE